MRGLKRVAVLGALCVLLLAPLGAGAVTYENTSGDISYNQIEWFYNDRDIDNTNSSGWDVAFKQYSGPSLLLGTHNCSQGDAGPYYQQAYNVYRAVRPSLPTGYTFCVLSVGNVSSGSFTGRIGWN